MTRRSSKWSLVSNGAAVRLGLSLKGLAAPIAATGFDALRARLSAIDVEAVLSLDMSMWFNACAEQARDIAAASEAGLSSASISTLRSVYQAGLVAGFDGVCSFLPDRMVGDLTLDELDHIRTIALQHGEALRRGFDRQNTAPFDPDSDGAGTAGQHSMLERLRPERRQPDIAALFHRLVVIEPTGLVAECPELHIRSCVQQAERIFGADDVALDRGQQLLVLATYEAGLRRGYDRLGQPQTLDGACGLAGQVMTAVAAAGWRHGDMVRVRWRTHQALLAVLFEEDRLC